MDMYVGEYHTEFPIDYLWEVVIMRHLKSDNAAQLYMVLVITYMVPFVQF